MNVSKGFIDDLKPLVYKDKLTNAVIKRAFEHYFNGINVVEAIEKAIEDFEKI